MIAAIMLRIGLAVGSSFFLPSIIALLLGGTGFTAWFLDWTDWKTAILAVVMLGACIALFLTNSRLGKIGIVVVLVIGGYIKGRIDEGLETAAKIKVVSDQIHYEYKEQFEAERNRLESVKRAAEQAAENERVRFRREQTELRNKLSQLEQEAINAKNASRPSLDVDAVKRVNRLRHDRAGSRIQGKRGKAKTSQAPILDDKAMPAFT